MNYLESLLEVVKKIENEDTDFIVGARQISEFRDYFISNPTNLLNYNDLAVFFDIEFEASGIPVSLDERKIWNEEALKIKDEEIKIIREKYSGKVKEACEKIIQKSL